MRTLLEVDTRDGRRAVIAHSTRADGDLSPSVVEPAALKQRRERASGHGVWHSPRQVHGDSVFNADVATGTGADAMADGGRPEADAVLTGESGRLIAIHTGDCVPIGLVHLGGGVAAVHAGWKGLLAGVVGSAADALRATIGAGPIVAAIGPHIHAARYAFGADDLTPFVERFGPAVRSTTSAGEAALDLSEATRLALVSAGVEIRAESPDCTAELAGHYWSHRARAEPGRIALTAELQPT